MKTIYLSRNFYPVAIPAITPGDVHMDPVMGECRRLTAKRFCLAAERAGKESDAITALLEAVRKEAEKERYDGRAVRDWYGLIGLDMPAREEGKLEYGVCGKCGARHWYGISELRNICFDCWCGPMWPPG